MERYPNLKEEVGSSNPGYEFSSLLDGKFARWSIASCALALACRPSVSKFCYFLKNKNKKPTYWVTESFYLIVFIQVFVQFSTWYHISMHIVKFNPHDLNSCNQLISRGFLDGHLIDTPPAQKMGGIH